MKIKSNETDRLAISVVEASKLTGLSIATINRRIKKETLMSHRNEGRRLIFVDDLVAYIKGEPQTGPKAYAENKQ